MDIAAYGGKLYMFGGFVSRPPPDRRSATAGFYEFDIASRDWASLSSGSLTARTDHGMVANGGRLYVFGGILKGGSLRLNDLHEFDILSSSWTDLSHPSSGHPPSPRDRFGFCSYNDSLQPGAPSARSTVHSDIPRASIAAPRLCQG
eukprot:351172-Rhodomonas_salina.2